MLVVQESSHSHNLIHISIIPKYNTLRYNKPPLSCQNTAIIKESQIEITLSYLLMEQ